VAHTLRPAVEDPLRGCNAFWAALGSSDVIAPHATSTVVIADSSLSLALYAADGNKTTSLINASPPVPLAPARPSLVFCISRSPVPACGRPDHLHGGLDRASSARTL
jgi:hypothetical protein